MEKRVILPWKADREKETSWLFTRIFDEEIVLFK